MLLNYVVGGVYVYQMSLKGTVPYMYITPINSSLHHLANVLPQLLPLYQLNVYV